MPHIRFRAVKKEVVEKLSETLAPILATEMQTSEDNFTFEVVRTDFYYQGKKTKSYPFVEVFWFERPTNIRDRCAQIITDNVKVLTHAEDVVIVFQALEKSAYYENGQHF